MVAGHLTPEVHVNKNGVSVIKHVNNTPTTNSLGKASLPGPAPTTTGSAAVRAERAINEFEAMGEEFAGTLSLHKNLRFLAEYKPKLLDRIMDEVRVANDAEMKVWKFILNEATDLRDKPFTEDEDKEEYLATHIPTLMTHVENVSLAVKLFPDDEPHIQGVNTYRLARQAYGVMRWGAGSRKYVETQAVMILGQTSDYKMDRIGGHGEDIWFIADNMEKVLPLLPELVKRKQTSKGLIQSLLAVESPALMEGAL